MARLKNSNLVEERDSDTHVVNSKFTMTKKFCSFLVELVGEKSENICQYLNFLYNNEKGQQNP